MFSFLFHSACNQDDKLKRDIRNVYSLVYPLVFFINLLCVLFFFKRPRFMVLFFNCSSPLPTSSSSISFIIACEIYSASFHRQLANRQLWNSLEPKLGNMRSM